MILQATIRRGRLTEKKAAHLPDWAGTLLKPMENSEPLFTLMRLHWVKKEKEKEQGARIRQAPDLIGWRGGDRCGV